MPRNLNKTSRSWIRLQDWITNRNVQWCTWQVIHRLSVVCSFFRLCRFECKCSVHFLQSSIKHLPTVNTADAHRGSVPKFIVPYWWVKVCYFIRLSYRPAMQPMLPDGPGRQPYAIVNYIPSSQRLWIGPQVMRNQRPSFGPGIYPAKPTKDSYLIMMK